MQKSIYDVTVLGAGFSGLSAALAAAKNGSKTAVVAQNNGASKEILAFNVPIYSPDNAKVYYEDMYEGGRELGNKDIVEQISHESIHLIDELEKIGIRFTKEDDKYAQRLVSGGTYPRAVYYKDVIGKMIINKLSEKCKKAGVDFYNNYRVLKVNKTEDGFDTIFGDNNDLLNYSVIRSTALVMATGGIGNLYSFTTYPSDIWGDGYSIGYQLGAELIDMEFVQFEPTIVVYPSELKGVVMPTALFGDGGILENKKRERFLKYDYDKKSENKYHKDEIALAISKEIQKGNGTSHSGVIFDVSNVSKSLLKGYPTLLNKLKAGGINLLKDKEVEVAPASHSHMGGIKIDKQGKTSLKGLFAAGEVTGGIHGANRLAGNSGTETLIMGKLAGKSASIFSQNKTKKSKEKIENYKTEVVKIIENEKNNNSLISNIQNIMMEYAHLIRNKKDLKLGLDKITSLKNNNDNKKYKGRILYLINLSEMIIRAALLREESRGYHYRSDYPEIDNKNWDKNIIIFKKSDNMKFSYNKTE